MLETTTTDLRIACDREAERIGPFMLGMTPADREVEARLRSWAPSARLAYRRTLATTCAAAVEIPEQQACLLVAECSDSSRLSSSILARAQDYASAMALLDTLGLGRVELEEIAELRHVLGLATVFPREPSSRALDLASMAWDDARNYAAHRIEARHPFAWRLIDWHVDSDCAVALRQAARDAKAGRPGPIQERAAQAAQALGALSLTGVPQSRGAHTCPAFAADLARRIDERCRALNLLDADLSAHGPCIARAA